MSVFKSKYEARTILDFSEGKVSKNSIKQSLRRVEVRHCSENVNGYVTFFNNNIKVGMYSIRLVLYSGPKDNSTKIKQYKKFLISVIENKATQEINIKRDARFCHKTWTTENPSVEEMADLIQYCKRLNDMRGFL
jgi:hypothetical protein